MRDQGSPGDDSVMVCLYVLWVDIGEEHMESKQDTTYKYDVGDSASRMDEILGAADNEYIDNGSTIPSRINLPIKTGTMLM